jgi:hypothetical protein
MRIYTCFFTGKAWFSTDSYAYFSQADAIIAGRPFIYTPNGYPLLVAAVKLIAPSHFVPASVIWINIIFSLFVVFFTIKIAENLTDVKAVCLGAGVLAATLPSQLNFVRYLYSEVPTAFFFLFGILQLLRSRHIKAGALLYTATLFRSTVTPVLPYSLICSTLFLKRWRPAAQIMWGALLAAMLYLPLEWRGIVKPPGNLAENIIAANDSNADSWRMGRTGSTTQTVEAVKSYIRFAQDHTVLFLKYRVVSLWDLWGPWPPAGDPARPRSFVARILIGLRCPLLLLAIIGFVRIRKKYGAWICAGPIVFITIIHVLLFSEARYTYVVEPLVIVLSSIGFAAMLGRLTPPDPHPEPFGSKAGSLAAQGVGAS